MSSMDFANSTTLAAEKLRGLCLAGLDGWSVGPITVRVRYSRGADFSGTCIYVDRLIYVNLGRHVRYPYEMRTNLARVKTLAGGWRRAVYTIRLRDGYELALFIFMHELYHLLVYRAGRNTRQKESMCDRFAARHLVDRFGCPVTTEKGERAPREAWDFQDLEGFVAAVRTRRPLRLLPVRKAVTSPRTRRETSLTRRRKRSNRTATVRERVHGEGIEALRHGGTKQGIRTATDLERSSATIAPCSAVSSLRTLNSELRTF